MKSVFLSILALSVAMLACGIYTFSPSALGDLKTIAIPLFDNQTTESGLREDLTDQLSRTFVTDNTLTVVPESQADGVLRGSVVSYTRDAYTYDQNEVVSEYICTIGLNVQFVNRRSGKVIWEEPALSNWGTYNATTENEDVGKSKAVAKLVEDILNRTVKGW